jgi:type IV pilus assembly protein PilB
MRVATLPTACGEKVVILSTIEQCSTRRTQSSPKKRSSAAAPLAYGAVGHRATAPSRAHSAALNVSLPEKNVIENRTGQYRLAASTRSSLKAGDLAARCARPAATDMVIMGEVRPRDADRDQSALKHLVLGALHDDAPGALSRLTEMGIEPFLTSSAVDCVLAQRLARRLCWQCREPYEPTREMLKKNDFPPEVVDRDELPTLYWARAAPAATTPATRAPGPLRGDDRQRGDPKTNGRAQECR